jgi:hypothetical protein
MNAVSGFFSGINWKEVIITIVIMFLLLMLLGKKS